MEKQNYSVQIQTSDYSHEYGSFSLRKKAIEEAKFIITHGCNWISDNLSYSEKNDCTIQVYASPDEYAIFSKPLEFLK